MKKGLDRREFMKMGMVGLGALCTSAAWFKPAFGAKEGDLLRIGLKLEPQQINPARDTETNSFMVHDFVYDSLFTRSAENKRVPRMAESWEWKGPSAVRFKLNKGMTFHDGAPVNAEAIQWCMTYWQDKTTPYNREYRGVSVDVIDEHTFEVKSQKPNALLLDRMVRHILPKAALTKMSEEEFAINPVGSGPYIFDKWVKGDRIRLNRWDRFYGDIPAFKRVEYRFIMEESVRLSALINNEIDIMPQVPAFLAPRLEKQKDTYVKVASSPQLNLLCLKVIDPSPLKDLRLRQALAYAVNVDEIIKQVFGGYAERASQPTLKVFFGRDPSIAPIPYKPEKARQLLIEAGFKNGLNLTMDTSQRYREQSEAMVGYWKDVGVNVKLNVLEDASYNVIRRRGGQPNDIFYVQFGHSVLDDVGVMIGLTSKMPFNTTGYKNPEFDKTYFSTVTTIDLEERLKLAHKLAEISMRDLPWIPLFSATQIWGLRKSVKFEPGPLIKHSNLYTAIPV